MKSQFDKVIRHLISSSFFRDTLLLNSSHWLTDNKVHENGFSQ